MIPEPGRALPRQLLNFPYQFNTTTKHLTNSMTNLLKFKLLTPFSKLPCRAHQTDSGIDVFSAESVTILPRSNAVVFTGVAAIIPPGYELQVRPRSGLSKIGIVAAFGTVDNGYRGNIGVNLFNHTDETYVVNVGDKIAQLVPMRVEDMAVGVTEELDETDRGENGFGSTGK